MNEIAAVFTRESCRLLTADYLPKIERSVSLLSDDLVWRRPNQASNSVGNLLLHLRGNVTQWVIGGVGGRAYERRRAEEFTERRQIPAGDLLEGVRSAVSEAVRIIADLDGSALLERRHIQGYELTVLEAIYHVVEHFSMHTGQIILLAKEYTGEDLALWEPPEPA